MFVKQAAKATSAAKVNLVLSAFATVSLVLFLCHCAHGAAAGTSFVDYGNSSTASVLRWFTDFAVSAQGSELPTPWVMSLPLSYWRALTLILSVALVFLGLRWLRATVALVRGS